MQIRYTSKAKKAIDQASKMSKSLHHHYIGTEHILIGLLKEGTGVAAQVLNDNGVELDKVMQLIEELIAPDAQVLTAEAKEYSPRALQVLEGKQRRLARFHAEEIGTEHILIAMMKETEKCGIPPFKYLSGRYPENVCGYPDRNGRRCEPVAKREIMNGKPVKKNSIGYTGIKSILQRSDCIGGRGSIRSVSRQTGRDRPCDPDLKQKDEEQSMSDRRTGSW